MTTTARARGWLAKGQLCLVILGWLPVALSAQSDGPSLALLQAPPSPAFVLLGIEPSSVERPGSVSDFATSLLNATDQLSVIPRNYAATIAPYWLLEKGDSLTFRDYRRSVGVSETIARTLALSVAFSQTSVTSPDEESTSMGVGIRFSILEGTIDDEMNPDLVALVDTLQSVAHLRLAGRAQAQALDAEYQRRDSILQAFADEVRRAPQAERARMQLRLDELEADRNRRIDEIMAPTGAVIARIGELASRVRLRRTGLKLDVAGGLVADFPDRSTQEAGVTRLGVWVTTGYEWDGGTVLGVARYLDADKQVVPSSLDFGGRLIFDGGDRFSASFEGLYRRVTDPEQVEVVRLDQREDPNAPIMKVSVGDIYQYRLALSLDYAISPNQTFSFSFGRDFEGVETQSSNLIAALNFALGLGTDRLGALLR